MTEFPLCYLSPTFDDVLPASGPAGETKRSPQGWVRTVTRAVTPQKERSQVCRTAFRRAACPWCPECLLHQNLFLQGSRLSDALQRNMVKTLANHCTPRCSQHGFPCSRQTWNGNFHRKVIRKVALGSGALREGERKK